MHRIVGSYKVLRREMRRRHPLKLWQRLMVLASVLVQLAALVWLVLFLLSGLFFAAADVAAVYWLVVAIVLVKTNSYQLHFNSCGRMLSFWPAFKKHIWLASLNMVVFPITVYNYFAQK